MASPGISSMMTPMMTMSTLTSCVAPATVAMAMPTKSDVPKLNTSVFGANAFRCRMAAHTRSANKAAATPSAQVPPKNMAKPPDDRAPPR